MPKPKISIWIYVAAGVLLLYGGGKGYAEAYIWAVASAIFALMRWRGVKEMERSGE
jgi:hypothetical protein